MNVAVVGAGYVGLVAGACFADAGNHVVMIDRDVAKVRALEAGDIPIYEPGLSEIVQRNVDASRLRFVSRISEGLQSVEVVILAVGTPSADDGSVDLGAILGAAREVAENLEGSAVVVTKSTVPVGFCTRLQQLFTEHCAHDVAVVSNPEFLKEGAAVADFTSPDRVIIGATDERAIAVMRHLYSAFMRRSDRLFVMDPVSAELTKYACNAMLAARVSFMNEMSRLCDAVGADVSNVRRGMGSDPRIGPQFLYASLGYGGSCFPKDVRALQAMGRQYNLPMRLVEATELANDEVRRAFFGRIERYFRPGLKDRTLAVWGLAFKAKTDDVRESPAMALVRQLVGAGATVHAHDPKAMANAQLELGEHGIRFFEDMYDALNGADALVICTEWQPYRTPNFGLVKERLASPVIFDGRNLYSLDYVAQTGFRYESIGRPVIEPLA